MAAVAAVGLAAMGQPGPTGAQDLPGGTWGPSQPFPGLGALTTTSGSVSSGAIKAITCTTTGNCVAVGYSVARSGSTVVDAPVAATETAGTWADAQLGSPERNEARR